MSEDRDKHSEAGKGDRAGLGHKVGRSQESRRARAQTEGKAGMGQRIPDKVRGEVDGSKGKTVDRKGRKS